MEVKTVTNSEEWNQFVASLAPNTFLQTWEWGQVQKQSGEDVRYLGVFSDGIQVAAALTVIVKARRGTFLLIPHGPIIAPRQLVFAELVSHCESLAKEVGAVGLRIAPLLTTTPENQRVFSDLGFRPAPIHIHAELTWVLDINKTEEEILTNMRKTTRHAVRKAQEAGVIVDIVSDTNGLDRFWPLYEATKDRHGFVPFSRNFLESQIKTFLRPGSGNKVGGYFAIAKHEGKDVAGAMLMQFGNTIFYHHGASIKLPSSVPAAQYLHWESIKEARRRGATRYNFWGIAPDDEPNHPFAGITTFKKGFGGKAINYMHAQDLPLSLGYWKLWLVDTWRKKQRGF